MGWWSPVSCPPQLSKELPPRTVGHSWQLTYSTSLHGSSLKSLYRKLSSTESPVLIVIKDALDEVERQKQQTLQCNIQLFENKNHVCDFIRYLGRSFPTL